MTCRCPRNGCDGNLTVRGDYAICPKCLRLVSMKWILTELEKLRMENERLRERVEHLTPKPLPDDEDYDMEPLL